MSEITFACQACKGLLKVTSANAGKKVRCPKCMAVNVAPGVADSPPAAVTTKPAPPAPEPAPRRPDSPKPRPAAPAVGRIEPSSRGKITNPIERIREGKQRSSPQTPPKKKAALKPLFLLVGGVAVVGVALLGWVMFGGGNEPNEIDENSTTPKKEVASTGEQKKESEIADKGSTPKEQEKPSGGGKMSAAEAKARLQSIRNLQALVEAMHNYNDTYRGLPPAGGHADPAAPKLAGMSWRTYLLPFLGKTDVYQNLLNGQYPLAPDAKPWNRPELLNLDFAPFSSPMPGKTEKPGHTYYRVFIGNGAAFEPKERTSIPRSFRDGTSNTILAVEAAEPVPWTKPEELVYDPKKPLPKLGGFFPDGFHAAMGDGRVVFFPNDTDEKLIRAMITRNGGETINDEMWPPPIDIKALERIAGIDKQREAEVPVLKMSPAEAKARLQSIENLQALIEAIHRYNGTYRLLPPAGGQADPAAPKLAGMSWRTYLLPFIGKKDVYQKLVNGQYPLAPDAKPWNRPELLKLDFAPFSSPMPGKTEKPGHTYYRVFIGNGAAFEPKERTSIPRSFLDGTSNTIFAVEAAEPVPWTKPEELVYDPKKPLPKLGGLFPDGFHAAMGDGRVEFFPNNTDEKVIRAMITRSGREPITDKMWPPPIDIKALERIAGIVETPVLKMSPAEAKARRMSVNNLLQLTLAMHSYHDIYKHFPPASGELDPRSPKLAGMSWRTYLLNLMEYDHLSAMMADGTYPALPGAQTAMSWNRPKLAMLDLYPFSSPIAGKTREAWHTFYRVFVGNGAAFEPNKQMRLTDFPDGVENTILIVEAGEPVPWTKPEELVYDPKKPLPKLGGLFPDGFYAGFADGKVRFIPRDTDEKLIRAMITRNGGEEIANLPPLADTKAFARAMVENMPPPKRKGQKKSDFLLSAKALAFEREREGNSEAFAAKYRGKSIELTGRVGSLDFHRDGSVLPDKFQLEDMFDRVRVKTLDKGPWWQKALPGQTVTLRGIFSGSLLDKCEIIEVTGPEPPTYTADQLAKEHADNPLALANKFPGTYLFVTGEIAKIKYEAANRADTITLKTTGKGPSVQCYIRDTTTTGGLAPAQTLRILTMLSRRPAPDRVDCVGGMILSLSGSKAKPGPGVKGAEITADQLVEDYVKDRELFFGKYNTKYVRVRGKLKMIGLDGYFVPGKKLRNGQPVKILLVAGRTALAKIPDGSTVTAEGYLNVERAGLSIERCRLVLSSPPPKEKTKPPAAGPNGKGKAAGTDLIAAAGFNDAVGINSDPTPDSPYPLDVKGKEGGAGEPGWAGPWAPVSPKAYFQKAIVFEGDGALFLTGTGLTRHWSEPQSEVFWIEQYVQVPAGGGVQTYIRNGEAPGRDGPIWKVADGKFSAFPADSSDQFLDSGFKTQPGKWHKVTLKIDVPKKEWEFHVDDRKFQPKQPLRFRTNQDSLSTIRYQCENVPGIYIDGLTVRRTPAPPKKEEKHEGQKN